MKCKNCGEISNGSIIKVDKNNFCLFCGRKVGGGNIELEIKKSCEHKWSNPVIATKTYDNRHEYSDEIFAVISCENCGEIKKQRI